MRSFTPPIYLTVEGKIERNTEKAIHFSVRNPTDGSLEKPQWFPTSQCKSISGNYDEIEGTFTLVMLPEWILKDKKLYDIALSQKEKIPKSAGDLLREQSATDEFFDHCNREGEES